MLNPQQTAAVKYTNGPLLVLAGAGSGKTRVITQKIAYLINECGYAANTICAVTFTNKAAHEMKKRLHDTLSADRRRGLQMGTFHTLGMKIVKRDVSECGLSPRFSIFDSEDCLNLMRRLLSTNSTPPREELLRLQQQISRWKNDLLSPKTASQPLGINASFLCDPVEFYSRYQDALQAYNAVDFDDLIRLPVVLLQQYPDVLARWQTKLKYLLIDEYQDSNACQYALVSLLVGDSGRLTVVGDDDQSVYGWRGAQPQNLAQLQQDYPALKLIKLEQNYRSTGTILHAANHLIAHNPHLFEKKLWSTLGLGDPLRVLCCQHEQDEAEQVVADMISHKLRLGIQFGDFAILYRGNHQSRVFEAVLRQHSIAYQISGGQSWFARSEVKDILAYFKLMSNETDDAAFLRVINTPKRGIGESTLEALGSYARGRGQSLYTCCDHVALINVIGEKQRNVFYTFKQWLEGVKSRCHSSAMIGVLREMIDESGYEAYLYSQEDSPLKAQKRMEQVWELIDWLARMLEKEPGSELSDLINKLILIDILDNADDPNQHTVQLMTLHASKGLEFPYVYLVGMEEELLPHRVSMDDNQIEEERRLAYVGITRAQKGLCFSLAKQRKRAGELQACLPSRFLDELPQESLEWFGKNHQRDEVKSKAVAKSHLEGLKHLLQ